MPGTSDPTGKTATQWVRAVKLCIDTWVEGGLLDVPVVVGGVPVDHQPPDLLQRELTAWPDLQGGVSIRYLIVVRFCRRSYVLVASAT